MSKPVKPNDIVQIRPDIKNNPMFGACMLIVTEVRPWGVQGFVQSLGRDGHIGVQAYMRLKWDEFEITHGSAVWTPGGVDESE